LSSLTSISLTKKEILGNYLSTITTKNWIIEISDNIDDSKKNISKLKILLNRLNSTSNSVNNLISDKSPEIFVKEFIKIHSNFVSELFARIHSPHEFSEVIIESDDIFVVRENGHHCPISQLSTGQRTALILSVFFALNSSAKKAPKIIVFDDPIAYVDDLNILSFIDFLVSVSIEKNVQIFFATANEKISKLFSSKFEFLKSEQFGFKEFNLIR